MIVHQSKDVWTRFLGRGNRTPVTPARYFTIESYQVVGGGLWLNRADRPPARFLRFVEHEHALEITEEQASLLRNQISSNPDNWVGERVLICARLGYVEDSPGPRTVLIVSHAPQKAKATP